MWHCIQYARIRVSTGPYSPLYGRKPVSENPYFCIFYAVWPLGIFHSFSTMWGQFQSTNTRPSVVVSVCFKISVNQYSKLDARVEMIFRRTFIVKFYNIWNHEEKTSLCLSSFKVQQHQDFFCKLEMFNYILILYPLKKSIIKLTLTFLNMYRGEIIRKKVSISELK